MKCQSSLSRSGRMAKLLFCASFVPLVLFTYLKSCSSESVSSYLEERLPESADYIVQDLVAKYSNFDHNDFWQPYSYDSSNTNREVVRIEKVEKVFISGKYLQWKYTRLGFNHYIVGITDYFIEVYGSDLQKVASIRTSSKLVGLTVYSRWNFEESCPEIIIPVATVIGIGVYKLLNSVITRVNEGWPLQYQIKTLEYCHVRSSTKLIVVPAEANLPVDIYNIAVNETGQVWYHQRLAAEGDNSHVAVYDLGSESYIGISAGKRLKIYAYAHEKGQYTVQQTIPLAAPSTQLVSFSIAYKHYLASVPGPGFNVEFFAYTGSQYVREESLATISAIQIHPLHLEDYRDEYALLAKQNDGQVHVFSYNGTVFNEDYNCNAEVCSTSGDLSKGIGFNTNGSSVYLLPTKDSSSRAEVIILTNVIEELRSPLYQQSTDIFSKFSSLSKRFIRWENVVSSSKEALQYSLSSSSGNTVAGKWKINQLSSSRIIVNDESNSYNSNDGFSIANTFRRFVFLETAWSDQDFKIRPIFIDAKLDDLILLSDGTKELLRDAIPLKSDEIQSVRGKQVFSGSSSTHSLESSSIQVPVINYQSNVNQFLATFVQKQGSIYVESSVSFSSYLTINDLYVNVLNGISVSNIARLSSANVFSCSLQFNNLLTVHGNIQAKLIGGIDLSEAVIRIRDIQGVKLTDGLVVLKEATIQAPVDSVYISKEVFQSILLRSAAQRVSSPLIFTEVVAYGKVKVNLVNEESLLDFANLIIRRDYQGLIRGHKRVDGRVSCESVRIDKDLNYYKFPEDLVSGSQRRLLVTGYKNFTHLTARKTTVDEEVDGLNTAHLVSRLGYDNLRGSLTFRQNVQFLDDLVVKAFVDGVQMESLKHIDTLEQYRSSYYPNADIEFNQPTYFKNLHVEYTINKKVFEEVFGGLLLFESKDITLDRLTTFKQSVSVESLSVESGTVNDLKLDEFLSLNTVQNISGTKIFTKGVTFSSLYALTAFDTVRLSQLFANAFRLSAARTILAQLTFEELRCGSTMTVRGKINNFESLESTVAVTAGRKEQVFEAPVEFSDLNVSSLKANGKFQIRVGRALGGLIFSSWYSRRISLSKDVRISFHFEISGSVQCLGNIETKRINEVKLSYLNDGILRSDRAAQTFLERFEISGLVRVDEGRVEFERQASGFSINNIIRNAFPLSSPNPEVITSRWDLKTLVAKELSVSGNTCGVDLVKLDVDSIRKGESDVYIRGNIYFPSGFDVKRELKVSRFNSIDLFPYLITLHTPQSVSGDITFAHSLIIEEELSSNGYINEVSLSFLARIYLFEGGKTHVLKYDVESKDILESASLNVYKLVQGINLKKYLSTNIITLNSGSIVTGEKTFIQSISVQGDIDVHEVNGINVKIFESTLILKTDSVRFSTAVTFGKSVDTPELILQYGDFHANGLVGGGNLTELIAQAVYSNPRRPVGSLSFEVIVVTGNIDDLKYLNGIKLESMITLSSSQNLGTLNVKEARLEGGNIEVYGLVLGYNLPKEYARTLLRASERLQMVTGRKEFDGKVYVKGNLQCLGDLRQRLLTLTESQTVVGNVEFTNTVRVLQDLDVSGLVNGYSLNEIVNEALTNGNEEVISGNWVFAGGVTFKENVNGNSALNGHELGKLVDDKKYEALTAEEGVKTEMSNYQEKCLLLEALCVRVSESPVRLEFFENHQQTIVLENKASKLISLTAMVITRILYFSSTCEVGSFQWDAKSEQFRDYADKLRLGSITHWDSIPHTNYGILTFTTVKSSCSSVAAGLHFITMDSTGKYSQSQPVSVGQYSHVKLVHDQERGRTTLLSVGEDGKTLRIYTWNSVTHDFTLELETVLSSYAERFEVTPHLNGVAILYHCDSGVHMLHYALGEGYLSSLGEIKFLAINGSVDSPMALFENHNFLYGIVQARNALDSVIQSDCSLQAFQSHHGELKLFQSLKSHALLSMTTIKFAQQVYVAALTKDAGVNIYRYMGLTGFERLADSPIKVSGGIQMISFNLEIFSYSLPRPFIVVSTGRTLQIIHSNINGDSKEYPDSKVYPDSRNSICNDQ